MGKIVVSEFISLDGVIEAPHHWHFPYVSDDMQAVTNAQIHDADAMLLGRNTYNEFAPFWSTQTDNAMGISDKLNSTPKYVVSTTLQQVDWNNSTLIKANVVEEITRLKQQVAGIIGITGSATLVQSLAEAGLIDEYQLMIHPIVVGSGKKLFKDGMATLPLKLVESQTFNGGVALMVFQPDKKAENS